MNAAFSLVLVALVSLGQAKTALDTARELYANAAFEEALTVLAKIGDDLPPNEARLAVEYRIFTLFALGRTGEAEAAAETLILRDPLAQLQSADASPRIRSMFDSVRARLLPQLIRNLYREGRAALDKKDFAAAARDLGNAQRLIADAAAMGVKDPGLADLRDLVDGFLVLAKAQPGAPAAVAPAVKAAGTPPTSAPAASPAAATAAKEGPRVYGVEDTDVTPPAIISQDMPEVPASLREAVSRAARPMIVAVTIDEAGRVRESEVLIPMNPVYDRLVIAASKNWRYRPATLAGAAVAYQRVISIAVK